MTENIPGLYELLEQYNLLSESFEVEFKSAKGGLPGSLWETYSAFANSEGGTIVLGVSEKDDQPQYDGLPKQQLYRYQSDFWSGVNNKAKVSVSLLTENMVQLLSTQENQHFLAIHIPPADYRQKPVYIGPDPLKGTYKRNHSGDYHCTPEEVRQMLADALPQKPDARLLENFSLTDLDETSILQYRQLFRSRKPGHPFLSENDQGLLQKIGGWRRDRISKKEGLTAAGLLMFGKHAAIVEAFPDYHVDYQEITDPSRRWSDRVFPDGTWEANIFQFYRRVWPKLSNSLPNAFKLRNGQRKDEDVLHEALREALVNALVHADYSVGGGIVVRRHLDAFSLSNPGNLLISLEQYYRGGTSVPRNTSIQNMFVLLGFGEKAGSGSSRIIAAWEEHHWRKPYIHINTRPARVELHLLMESLLPQKSIENLVVRFGESVRTTYGSQLIALITAEIEGSISNVRLQQLVNEHSYDISKMLRNLCKMGYLVPDGRGRSTTYKLAKSTSPTNLESSPTNLESSPTNLESSPTNLESSPTNLESSPTNLESPKLPSRMSREKLSELVLEVATKEFLTVEQIAQMVERKPAYLLNEIFPELLQQRKLVRKYESPNHPNQAYKTHL